MKALRVAACLLIAHFVILVGLALVAQGGPNFSGLVVPFLMLIVATTALFKPRKWGWLGVLAYAVVIFGHHGVGIWATWANPNIPAGMKMAAFGILAVIDLLVVAALVLVFKPSSFAAFAAPAPAAAQEPAAKG